MLFDVVTDRSESRNLFEQQPAIARAMTEQLRKWQVWVEMSLTGADYAK